MPPPNPRNTHQEISRYRESIERLTTSLAELTDSLPDPGTLPSAESVAMAELAQESKWAVREPGNAWGVDPVFQAHSVGIAQLHMAVDASEGMSHLLYITDPLTVFAPAALLRTVVEGAARSKLIFEPGIGTKTRIVRGMNERIANLYWTKKQGPPDARAVAQRLLTEIRESARSLGIQVLSRKQSDARFLEPGRPSMAAAIKHLYGDFSRPDSDLNRVINLYASGFVHAGLGAFTSLVDRSAPQTGLNDLRPIGMTGATANLLLSVAFVSISFAGQDLIAHHGWDSPSWSEASKSGYKTVVDVMSAMKSVL